MPLDRDIVTAELEKITQNPSSENDTARDWNLGNKLKGQKKSVRISGRDNDTSSLRMSPGVTSALEQEKVLGNVYRPSSLDNSEPIRPKTFDPKQP